MKEKTMQQKSGSRWWAVKAYAADGILNNIKKKGETIKFAELVEALGTNRFEIVEILKFAKSAVGNLPDVIVKADGTPWRLDETQA